MFAPQPGRRARSRLSEKSATVLPIGRSLRRGGAKKAALALVRNVELPAERGGMPPRIARFLETAELPSPCRVILYQPEGGYSAFAPFAPHTRHFQG